jgi:Rieske Fe-S protein
MTQQPEHDSDATRRALLAGVGIAGLAGTLAACNLTGGGSSANGYSSPTNKPPTSSNSPMSEPSGPAKPVVLGHAHEIPVGGGKVFAAHKVVVTQPKKGEFKAFSAICTHMQCVVDKVADGTIDCPCHGSKYAIANAKVVAGPAPSPLPRETIKVKRGRIILT